jgi:hypothetical protein
MHLRHRWLRGMNCFRVSTFVAILLLFLAWPDKRPDSRPGRLAQLLEGCGEVCDVDIHGQPSLFFEHIEKKVDCEGLLTNQAIDAAMSEPDPPVQIPPDMLDAFTYHGKIPVKMYLPKGVLNQRYLAKNALSPTWGKAMIDDWAAQCARKSLPGTYGVDATKQLLSALTHIQVANASILVIGSEQPWVEACLLGLGARHITTLEYGHIVSNHPHVETLTPDALRANSLQYLNRFDAVVTYSSVEHSGLGRYGDAMNPWGDRQAIARAWCMTKPGGRLAIGVPAEGNQDIILYNAHRNYGPVQLPHLLANWKQIWQSLGGVQGLWICEKELQ